MSAPHWWKPPRRVSVVVDTPGWFDPFAEQLVADIRRAGDVSAFYRDAWDILPGSVAFYLSCLKLTPPAVLSRSEVNLVVHASALPKGRGFSPIVWQVLEGKDEIPVSLILAANDADTGDLVLQENLRFRGHELNSEIRDTLGKKTIEMCRAYLAASEPLPTTPQEGEASWYRRRRAEDSRLSVEKSLAEQFDLLRVVDNERYPAFFDFRGHRYVLRIDMMGPSDEFQTEE